MKIRTYEYDYDTGQYIEVSGDRFIDMIRNGKIITRRKLMYKQEIIYTIKYKRKNWKVKRICEV